MIIESIEKLAGHTTSSYRVFALGLLGLRSKALEDLRFISAQGRRIYTSEAQQIAFDTAIKESRNLYDMTDKVRQEAVYDALTYLHKDDSEFDDEKLREVIGEHVEQVTQDFQAQLSKSVRAFARNLQKLAIRVDMIEAQRGWQRSAAVFHVREFAPELTQLFTDKAGRKWQADRYVHTLVRGYYLDLYNETYLYVLSKFGVNQAQLTSPGKKMHKFVFAIFEGEGLPTYADLKQQRVIHPNATYLVSGKQ